MNLQEVQAAEAKLLLPTYERNPILFAGGAGMYLVDDQGDRYLDLLSRHRSQRAGLWTPGGQ